MPEPSRQPVEPDERDFTILRRRVPVDGPGNTVAVALAALAALAGAVVFVVGILADASVTVLGTGLFFAFGGLALALRRVFAALYPQLEIAEHRDAPSGPSDELAVVAPLRRRSFLMRGLLAVGGLVSLALLAPITALAERRRDVPRDTAWQAGVRLVDDDDQPVRADDVPTGGLSRAWPEGVPRQELAAVFVVRLREGERAEAPTNLDWVVDDTLIAYSKVCTHAGCPVALYQAARGQLFCPCHQASFDVVRGATPTFGPASRPLAQLPLGTDDDGYLIALGDFVDPVGPPVG